LREAIEKQNAPAWQTLRAFDKPFVFLAGEGEKVMGAEENLHFLTNSIPGAQGQPHERSHADHFTQEEIGDILADRVIRFIEANPELLAAPAYVEVEHGRNGKPVLWYFLNGFMKPILEQRCATSYVCTNTGPT